MKRLVGLVLTPVLLSAIAACSHTAGANGSGSTGGPETALTVAEALATDADGPLRVRGALVFDGRVARLCDSLAESYPPQCVEGTIITGFDASIIPPDADTDGRVRWMDSIELIVTREDGALRYVSTGKTA